MTNFHLCRYCKTGLIMTVDGPVHRDGGAYVQKCLDCGWKGNKEGSYQECPDCHSTSLMDDHIATI